MSANIDRTIQIGTAVGIATLGIDSFHKYLPSVGDIRAAAPGDSKMRADVHAGELVAGLAITTVSFMAASIANTPLPVVIGGISFLAMIGVYEWLLNTPPTRDS